MHVFLGKQAAAVYSWGHRGNGLLLCSFPLGSSARWRGLHQLSKLPRGRSARRRGSRRRSQEEVPCRLGVEVETSVPRRAEEAPVWTGPAPTGGREASLHSQMPEAAGRAGRHPAGEGPI